MTYTITVGLTNPRADIEAVKEALAYYCEQYGDLGLIAVSASNDMNETPWARSQGERNTTTR